uniref:Glutathione reductase n=1 Tax=Chromera velia CCMP2878 TaxID=1169474 RepID=A0A0G4GTF2_9ALVE|eukprot:Cvel_23235.t1-p1 / transcript=Cvel_23235.t1 / gene=Cvel_23235 / organism=Chromera_velia_CCMP2878 / gene_product=Glutathione reductase, putative / transcript_product=Glutathione reductase, putative / location=Cvel_scaffold2372:8952-15471(+) / protein_length=532 / sequence_SO=supercontig / SO=protein_coding / is_pseudo=false
MQRAVSSSASSVGLSRLSRVLQHFDSSTTNSGNNSRALHTSTKASMSAPVPPKHFEYFVLGAGSGGIASARRAAGYGAKVGVAENKRLGGTCVNVGCVPKKVMWNTAATMEVIHEASNFGFAVGDVKFDWGTIKARRDHYVKRLNGIYANNLGNSKVEHLTGTAKFTGPKTLDVDGQEVTADHILIAVGGRPSKLGVPGDSLLGVTDSDGFFELERLPKKIAVVGAGYIAVELAGMMKTLGADVHLFVRGDCALRKFEDILKEGVDAAYKKMGIKIHPQSVPEAVEEGPEVGGTPKEEAHVNPRGLTLKLKDGRAESGFETILVAVGRVPEVEPLALDKAGIELGPSGHIKVDEFQNTNVKGVYALGDVCGKIELTPMAIAAGRRLSDRLFNNMPDAKVSYLDVPTVIFTHPPIGTQGLTEAEAKAKFGEQNIKVYRSTFVNLWYGPWPIEPSAKPKSVMKLICLGKEEKIVGLHVFGMGADEMLQGFGVAVRMGATKADFDACVAIHPTAAEEFVTFAPWGTGGMRSVKDE